MSLTRTKENLIKKNSLTLEREVNSLRSAIISFIGQDDEGFYRPKLVKEVFKATKEKPRYKFKNADFFIKELSQI